MDAQESHFKNKQTNLSMVSHYTENRTHILFPGRQSLLNLSPEPFLPAASMTPSPSTGLQALPGTPKNVLSSGPLQELFQQPGKHPETSTWLFPLLSSGLSAQCHLFREALFALSTPTPSWFFRALEDTIRYLFRSSLPLECG